MVIDSDYSSASYKHKMASFEGFSAARKVAIRAAVADYEVVVTPYWAGVMQRARKARKMTQAQLADAVGTVQPNISDIEKMNVAASQFVPAICMALEIPMPTILVADEYDQRWVEAGRVLRARSLRRFLHYLAIFEEEAELTEGTEDHSDALSSNGGDSLSQAEGARRRHS